LALLQDFRLVVQQAQQLVLQQWLQDSLLVTL
jgi:hypothetical protein